VIYLVGADSKDNPAGCAGTSFLDACNTHDKNYQKCHSSEDAKGDADNEFIDDLVEVCSDETGDCYDDCIYWGGWYGWAVKEHGDDAFQGDQTEACICCNP